MAATPSYIRILGRARRRLANGLERQEGQALTEFAIVAPLIVMVLLFSLWFVELVQIKLKVQEAARYVAWEAVSYPLHDYAKGGSALSGLASKMQNQVRKEAMLRYADLDSTSIIPKGTRIFSARWTPPIIYSVNQPEELVYGGSIVNFIFNIAATVIDFFSALSYKNFNYVAMALVASGKNYGGARTARMFGSPEWGFNKDGYHQATVSTWVSSPWLKRSLGPLAGSFGVMIMETHGVLADTWNLDKGEDVYGNTGRPGVSKNSPYWKQVDRMFFINKRTHSVAKGFINLFKLAMRFALAFTFSTAMPPGNLGESDFLQTAVVSKNYKDPTSGKVTISQDRGATRTYDTAPLCAKGGAGSGCPGGDALKPYGETLDARGKNFMGCKREMSLGCPSSTLSQDNPFGDYLYRQ